VWLQAQGLHVHRFISVVCCSFEGWRCLFTMWKQGCSTQTTSWQPLSLKPVKNSLPTSPLKSLVVSEWVCVLFGWLLFVSVLNVKFWTLSFHSKHACCYYFIKHTRKNVSISLCRTKIYFSPDLKSYFSFCIFLAWILLMTHEITKCHFGISDVISWHKASSWFLNRNVIILKED